MKKNIFICCTEQSGENICYNILKRLDLNKINVDGVCGSRSENFIREKFHDISEFKSIGIFEIIFSIKKYINMIRSLKNLIIEKNYDLVICIDSPDFNYNLAKSLRKSHFTKKMIQIVAPTVWAWRKNRAKKFAYLFNEIFLLFEFEKKYFTFPNFTSTFIGHPIFHVKKRKNTNKFQYIALLFGSRENEVNKLFLYFNEIEKYINEKKLNWKFFIPTLPHLKKIIEKKTQLWKTETFITDEIEKFDKYYDEVFVSVTCSGTATLEIAKRNIPQIVIYKLNYLTELLLSLIVKVKNACILNIVTKEMIIPEIVNSKLNKFNLIDSFELLLNDKKFRDDQLYNINKNLPKIQSNKSPYEISVKRIMSLI